MPTAKLSREGLKSASRSGTKGSSGKSRRRLRETVGEGGEPGSQPVRRRRPKISAGTAEFLAQIDKVRTQGKESNHPPPRILDAASRLSAVSPI